MSKNVGDDLFGYELALAADLLRTVVRTRWCQRQWPPVRAGRHHCPEGRSPAEDRWLRSPEPPQAESIAQCGAPRSRRDRTPRLRRPPAIRSGPRCEGELSWRNQGALISGRVRALTARFASIRNAMGSRNLHAPYPQRCAPAGARRFLRLRSRGPHFHGPLHTDGSPAVGVSTETYGVSSL
jgi:hypothetical protein